MIILKINDEHFYYTKNLQRIKYPNSIFLKYYKKSQSLMSSTKSNIFLQIRHVQRTEKNVNCKSSDA